MYNKLLFPICIGLLYFIVIVYSAWMYPIDQNESWMYAESYYSITSTPYKDYFSHRLPLFQIIYGIWMNIFSETLFSMRILSSILAASSIAIVLYVCRQLTNNILILLVASILLWNVVVISALSKALIYPLVSFLYSLTILFLYKCRDNYKKSMLVFFFLQMLIWSCQYPISAQAVLILLFLIVAVMSVNDEIFFSTKLISIVILPILIIWLYMALNDDYRLIYDTFTFNMQQVPLMKEMNILNENYDSLFKRIIDQRKREVVQFLPLIFIFIIAIFYWLINSLSYLKTWKFSWKAQIYLYSGIYFLGYYGAFFVVGYDYPVTKVYIFFPAMILITLLFSRLFEDLDKIKQQFIAGFLLITVLFWPYVQGVKQFYTYNPHEDLNAFNSVVHNYVDDGVVFSLYPIILQGDINIDLTLSMGLYGFLNDFDVETANYHHLPTFKDVNNKINKKYYSGILISNRFKNINTNMSRILLPHYDKLMRSILNNYYLVETYQTKNPTAGLVDIYLKLE